MKSPATKRLQFPCNLFKYALFIWFGDEPRSSSCSFVRYSCMSAPRITSLHYFRGSQGPADLWACFHVCSAHLEATWSHEHSVSFGESGELQNLQEMSDNPDFPFSTRSSSAVCSSIKHKANYFTTMSKWLLQSDSSGGIKLNLNLLKCRYAIWNFLWA